MKMDTIPSEKMEVKSIWHTTNFSQKLTFLIVSFKNDTDSCAVTVSELVLRILLQCTILVEVWTRVFETVSISQNLGKLLTIEKCH